MAELHFHAKPTIAAIDVALEASQDTSTRPYLGMSQIGNQCDRALWFGFRWCTPRKMPASALKAIEDGHRGEDIMADRLRMVAGVTLHTVNPQTGKQFGVEGCGGHLKGHLDGAILGVHEAPKTWHVWEHKQVNETKFKKLESLAQKLGEKEALKEWDATYYGQAISYMGFTGMERHFLTVATPGGRAFTSIRTEFNRADFDRYCARAQHIIDAPTPPERLSEDPAWYECKWCEHRALCHGTAAPLPTCRSCSHSTPEPGGTWTCARHQGKTLSVPEQKQGCQAHRVIPILLRNWAEPIDASETDNWIKYRLKDGGEFVNGAPPAGYSSDEIHACKDKLALGMVADQFKELREQFGAEIVG